MIQVFVTGGTFDKEYNYITGKLYFKDSHLQDMFKRGRCTLDVQVKTLMMVDSLEMTDKDRELILDEIKQSASDQFLITHGTDTMSITAKYLAEAGLEGKTIILTGAMIPYAFGSSSDGFFNLGSSIAFAQCLTSGVYISMNGRYFSWNNVKKNTKSGFFETL